MKIGTDQIGWCLFFCNRHIGFIEKSFVKCNYAKTKEDFSMKSIYENLGETYRLQFSHTGTTKRIAV